MLILLVTITHESNGYTIELEIFAFVTRHKGRLTHVFDKIIY